MKLIINEKASEVFYENKFYPTGKEVEVPFTVGIKLAKNYNAKVFHEKQNYDPELFQKGKYFAFTSDIDRVSGWGNVTFSLLKNSAEYDVSLTGRLHDVKDTDIWRMAKRDVEEKGVMIWHEQPKETWDNTPFSKNVAIVPFETTKVPATWVPRINAFDLLIVPCEQNKQAFIDSGVVIPIEVVPWGYEPGLFKPVVRQERTLFTFGTMGALSIRKGTDVLIDAFREAFPWQDDVRLICKTSYNQYPFMVKDKRIVVQMTPVSHEELMRDFFQEVDCFVFPTRGEGCGMPPMEAMATGLPVIVTKWSGPLEYMTEDCGWFLDYTMEHAKDFEKNIYHEDCGDWACPSKDHLVQLMRYAYEHKDECKAKGEYAAKYMAENWTWAERIKRFKEVLEKYL